MELGSKYTDEEWSQELMTLNDFIDKFVQVNSLHDIVSLKLHYVHNSCRTGATT